MSAEESLLQRLDSFALRTRATPVATGQGAAQLVRTMLPAVKKDAVADYLATHPSLVDLSAPETERELTILLHRLEDIRPSPLANPARDILTAWRNLRSGSSPSTEEKP